MNDPIAYTYEADYHCPDCTEARFGRSEAGFTAEEAEDNEGNPVGAVFSWDEWWDVSTGEPETLVCGTCGEEIAETGPSDEYREEAREAGYKAGTASGSWVFDGNSSEDTARRILQGFEDGDPKVMDMQPAPLSGEWAGESIVELSDKFGLRLDNSETADAFEEGFSDGYWDEVQRSARAILGLDDVSTSGH